VQPHALLSRVRELLAKTEKADPHSPGVLSNELLQGTVSLMVSLYGEKSERVEAFNRSIDRAGDFTYGIHTHDDAVKSLCQGALLNLRAELEGGLLGSLQLSFAASELSDFLQLAKLALDPGTDGGKNVAAVLTAAAFEDTIRRMGETLAGVQGRPDLEWIIGTLKTAGVLKAPLLGQVLAHLKFRNYALHADWLDIDKVSVETAWQLVQGLLLQYFQ